LAAILAIATLAAPLARPAPMLAAPLATRASADIPDNAVFLQYSAARFRIAYIEGWGRRTAGQTVTFSDKDSMEQVTLLATPRGALLAFVRGHELSVLRQAGARTINGPAPVALPGGRALLVHYAIPSAPDQVTGKVVTLNADRYYIPGPHQLAVITLASPVGDDNVDAFLHIARSFVWR
jgi:hypothetical protein